MVDHAAKNGQVTHIDAAKDMPKEYVPVSVDDMNSIEFKGMKVKPDGEATVDDNEEKKKDLIKTIESEAPRIGPFEIFRFADSKDILLMVIGTLAAIVHGVALPGMIIVFGEMISTFVDQAKELGPAGIKMPSNVSLEEVCEDPVASKVFDLTCSLLDNMRMFAIYYIIIGVGVIIVGYIHVVCFGITGERQARRIRLAFFSNVIRQNIGWFDTHDPGELNTRLSDDINKVREGVGDKVSSVLQFGSSFVAGVAIGFAYGWKLTLVVLAMSPALGAAAVVMTVLIGNLTKKELDAYAKAGAVAEEVISSIRTVTAFGGQDKECIRYNSNLSEAKKAGIKKSLWGGLGFGGVWLVIFWCYALGFWYGGKLVREESDNYDVGNMLIVFFAVIIGAFSIGSAVPNLQAIASARGAASIIYYMIDKVPPIDSYSVAGKKPSKVIGDIQFEQVHFQYPSRTEVKVLKDFTINVQNGQVVALVGPSGCGKSTTVQLLQRFYDPISGAVRLDGTDIRELNVNWLRNNIGIVSQEPVLFGTTIAENIRYGRLDVTQAEIEVVAKMANAHNFIMELPQKYETLVGERGAQLSGGQKQRVAIARALVSDPRILLLDEATSALDTESESIVQEALDKASAGRTTLVIAHRLSTIRAADLIIGIEDGCVVEQGTHSELMERNGLYYKLVSSQMAQEEEEDNELAEFKELSPKKKQLQRMLSQRAMSIQEEREEEKTKEEKLPDAPMMRMLALNRPEWLFLVGGCFSALVNGGVQPAFAVIFSNIINVFSKTEDEQESEILIYVYIFLGLGVASLLTFFGQGFLFGISGERLTMRLRALCFRAMLRQDISWFDDHTNNTGALCTRLATDASQVQGATGSRVGQMVQNMANMGAALVIAFIYSWEMALLIIAFVPFIGLAGFVEMRVMAGATGQNKNALEDAGKTSTEAIENIRTVASLSREDKFYELYKAKIKVPYKSALKRAHLYGAAYGFAQGIMFFAYAAAFYVGAILIRKDRAQFLDVMIVFSAIVFGAMAIGQASSFAPDFEKAKTSASRVFLLLDMESKIDPFSEEGIKPAEGSYSSAVSFNGVHFNYPTRPNVPVLRGLDVSVSPGQTLALVGSSGCGKSTTVSLIERFYDPHEGHVHLDKHDIKDLNTQWLRSQMGIVSQEPILFDCSISENIAYGDNTREIPMDQIIKAARDANIHSFIESLPMQYATNVGDKGTQLSGGQKQRVAIARALIRNPKILLLDEATSALDTESEKVVQVALDKARAGRTCIVIAHRLSTVFNADKIAVFRGGQVMEQGTHSELMNKQGFYYKLATIQRKQE